MYEQKKNQYVKEPKIALMTINWLRPLRVYWMAITKKLYKRSSIMRGDEVIGCTSMTLINNFHGQRHWSLYRYDYGSDTQ